MTSTSTTPCCAATNTGILPAQTKFSSNTVKWPKFVVTPTAPCRHIVTVARTQTQFRHLQIDYNDVCTSINIIIIIVNVFNDPESEHFLGPYLEELAWKEFKGIL